MIVDLFKNSLECMMVKDFNESDFFRNLLLLEKVESKQPLVAYKVFDKAVLEERILEVYYKNESIQTKLLTNEKIFIKDKFMYKLIIRKEL